MLNTKLTLRADPPLLLTLILHVYFLLNPVYSRTTCGLTTAFKNGLLNSQTVHQNASTQFAVTDTKRATDGGKNTVKTLIDWYQWIFWFSSGGHLGYFMILIRKRSYLIQKKRLLVAHAWAEVKVLVISQSLILRANKQLRGKIIHTSPQYPLPSCDSIVEPLSTYIFKTFTLHQGKCQKNNIIYLKNSIIYPSLKNPFWLLYTVAKNVYLMVKKER